MKIDEIVGYLCVLCGNHNVLKQIEHKKEKVSMYWLSLKNKRARDGDRTRDPLLGKEVLHR